MTSNLAPSSLPLPDAPYRGIKPFRFLDQQIFTARDEEAWDLLSKVTLYRAVLLYGDSGTGKSSLINAGLVPQALKENFIPNRLRIQPFSGREIKVERMLKSDGSNPSYLRSSFTSTALSDYDVGEPESFELSLSVFGKQLELTRLNQPQLQGAEMDADRSGPRHAPLTRPLLIFDQFEELITLFEEAHRGARDAAEAKRRQVAATRVRRRILVTLVKLIRDPTLPVKLVFVFREDYFAKLAPLFEYCPELLDQAQRLLPPKVETLPQIIRAPFANQRLRTHFLALTAPAGSELSEGMTRRIASDLGQRSEADLVNLSELQIVCLLLWKSSDPEQLYEKRGVQGLLEDYGADVFRHLPPELQDKAVALLATMLTASNTRNIKSEDDLKRTAQDEKLRAGQYYDVIHSLCEHQLVRRERHRNLYFYELASEYLVPWINKLAAERELHQIAAEADQERLRVEKELRRALRFRRLLIFSSVLMTVLLVVGAFAAYFYIRSVRVNNRLVDTERRGREAEQKEKLAEQRAEAAQFFNRQASVAIQVVAEKDDVTKMNALQQIKQWVDQRSFPSELILLLVAAQSTTESKLVKQDLSKILARAAQNDAELSKLIGEFAEADTSVAGKLPLQFNVYLADHSQLGLAQKASAALAQHGYVVLPDIEIGKGFPPDWDNELRFFRKVQNGQSQLGDILSLLKSVTSSTNWKVAYNPQYANTVRGRAGQLELWFAKPSGRLEIGFVDDEGKPLPGVEFTVIFEPTGENRVHTFRSKATTITVPSGTYDVTIKIKDFKDIHRPLSVGGREAVKWYDLRPSKEKPGP